MAPDRPLVAALPRGGVPVGYEVAAALGCPLDVLVVRKVGVPDQPELAMGALGEDGVVIRNAEILAAARVPEAVFERVAIEERRRLEARAASYRAAAPGLDFEARTVIVVDDGLATGATMQAAIAVARARGAGAVWAAAPVAPPEVARGLAGTADRVVVLETPSRFMAVGAWYRDFTQTSDDEVIEALRLSRRGGRLSPG